MTIRLTPKGFAVLAWVARISARKRSGVMEPQASTPKPPAFDMAATSDRSETQVIATPRIACSTPSKLRPLAESA